MYSFKSVNLDFDWQTLKYKGTVQIDGYVLPTENGIVSGKVQCHGANYSPNFPSNFLLFKRASSLDLFVFGCMFNSH